MNKEKTSKVLIDKIKGFEIFFDKETEIFSVDREESNLHLKSRSLWDIKKEINLLQVEEINKTFYIKSGYFNKTIAKIQLFSINKSTKNSSYKILEDTEDSYDVGKKLDDWNIVKTYEINEENTKIYNKVKELENKINEIKLQQKLLVDKLK